MIRTIVVSSVLALGATLAAGDLVTLTVGVDWPDAGGEYVLAGQSSFFVTNANGGVTSGGQLDNIGSGGAIVSYDEVFPPPALGDYLDFGYVGLVETRDASGAVIDLSLVVAMRPGVGAGMTIGDILAGMDEATLVGAMSTQFDSPEFFGLQDAAVGTGDTRGAVGIPPIGRPGDTLELVAFTGGAGGDLGVVIGSLSVSIVPAPGAAGLLAVLGLVGARRRR